MPKSKSELGSAYSQGCIRMHNVITALYESLFDITGSPKESQTDIERELSRCQTKIRYELDYVRESLKDHNGE